MTDRVRCVKRGAINDVGVGELSVAARVTRLLHILGRRCHGANVDMMRMEERVEWNGWNERNGRVSKKIRGFPWHVFTPPKSSPVTPPLFCGLSKESCFIAWPSNSYNIAMALD
jgi:hypothetical protein